MMNYIEMYLDFLKKNTIIENRTEHIQSEEIVEMSLPFLDRHNDYITLIVVKQEYNNYCISDNAYTLNDLETCGVNVNAKNNQWFLMRSLLNHGISLDRKNNEIYKITNEVGIPASIQSMLQGIMEITYGIK